MVTLTETELLMASFLLLNSLRHCFRTRCNDDIIRWWQRKKAERVLKHQHDAHAHFHRGQCVKSQTVLSCRLKRDTNNRLAIAASVVSFTRTSAMTQEGRKKIRSWFFTREEN